MENAKSIIDIEVNDDAFKRFGQLFEQYQKTLGEQPGIWSKIGKAASGAMNEAEGATDKAEKAADGLESGVEGYAEGLKNLSASLMAHADLLRELDAEQQERNRKEAQHEKDILDQEKKKEDSLKRQNALQKKRIKTLKDGASLIGSMVAGTASFALNVAKFGAGIGLGLLGGGFFGMERMGSSATQDRRQSNVYGMTTGQLRAWQTDYAGYGDSSGLLSAASNAYSDAGTRALFQRAGVSNDTIKSGNTSQIAEETLKSLTNFFRHNQGPNAQAIWQSRGYDQIMPYNEIRAFAGRSTEEQNRFYANLHKDQSGLNTPESESREWQDFYTSLQRAGQMLKTTFLDGLAKLTGPVGDLAGALNGLLKEIIDNGTFKEGIKYLSDGIKSLSQSIRDGSLDKYLNGLFEDLKNFSESIKNDLPTILAGLHGLAETLGVFIPQHTRDPQGKTHIASNSLGHDILAGAAGGAIAGGIGGAIPTFGVGAIPGALLGGITGAAAGGLYHIAPQSWQDWLSHTDTTSDTFLNAVSKTESGGNPNAVSKAGAQGLFQLMPSVQQQYGVTNPFDPEQSRAGAKGLLSDLKRRFNNDPVAVSAAYNAGGGRVHAAMVSYGKDWLSHLPQETQNYVGRVAANYLGGGGNKITVINATGGSAIVQVGQAAAS